MSSLCSSCNLPSSRFSSQLLLWVAFYLVSLSSVRSASRFHNAAYSAWALCNISSWIYFNILVNCSLVFVLMLNKIQNLYWYYVLSVFNELILVVFVVSSLPSAFCILVEFVRSHQFSAVHVLLISFLLFSDDGEGEEAEANRSNGSSKTLSLGRNGSLYDSPLLHSPNSGHAVEYKRGYVMRKCCVQPNGRKGNSEHIFYY